uniref:Glycosyltransferase n=1 Tax=Setaria italica TaxID=4555 RepID=K4AJ62_SETIT
MTGADGAGSSSRQRMHVVIFPWLAFGHLLPGLELAQRLASRGHRASSLVSTPRNLARLPPLPAALAPRVDLVPLPLPRLDGLPDGAESTNDVPFDAFELHREAFDGLAAPFSAFLDAACAQGGIVPCAMLLHLPASIFAALAGQPPRPEQAGSGQQHQATGDGQPAAVAPRFETERNRIMYSTEGASGISVGQRFFLTVQRCNFIGKRTCAELEPEALPRLPTLFGKPVVPFVLLPPSPDGGRAAAGKDGDDAITPYEVPLSIELVHELALGLELAGVPFLWALRKPTGGVADADVLPPGFEERTRGRGLVAMGWVPQISILAHGAVGAFLTHCGWNSTIEGLLFGHPLIMLPIYGDQGSNARLMEGRKIGVQVATDEDDGSFDRHDVVTAVRAVMSEDESRSVFVANAKKLQEIVADRACQERCIDEFVERLRSSCLERARPFSLVHLQPDL